MSSYFVFCQTKIVPSEVEECRQATQMLTNTNTNTDKSDITGEVFQCGLLNITTLKMPLVTLTAKLMDNFFYLFFIVSLFFLSLFLFS